MAMFFLLSITKLLSQIQPFTISCDTAGMVGTVGPLINMYRPDNLFDAYPKQNITLQKKGKFFEATINISKPVFMELRDVQLLALPNQKVRGVLKGYGDIFLFEDSNNINKKLFNIGSRIAGVTTKYFKSSTFSQFLLLYDSLKKIIDTELNIVSLPVSKERYSINNEALSAIRQYCNARLLHFLMLPVLLKGNYSSKKLIEYITRDAKINEPEYLLQVQPGRIFLKTFFTELLLPESKYDLSKALVFHNLFLNSGIRKFLTFHYFDKMPGNDETLIMMGEVRKNFSKYEKVYTFTKEEMKTLNFLKGKMDLHGRNIISLFNKQILVNDNEETVGNIQKENLLKNNGKVIIDYWASWCIPCIEKIQGLKSGEKIIEGEKYKLLFISVDDNQQNWLEKKYPALNSTNSFRLANLKMPSFYTAFEIREIPRLFLIENGVLNNQHFSY